MMPSRIQLQDAFKAYTQELDKLLSPRETVRRVREKLERSGADILTRTLRIDTGRLGIPVTISLCGTEAVRTIGTRKQMGKGCTPEQAEASALMELVERYSFFSFVKNGPFLEGTYQNFKEKALPFSYIPLSVYDPDPGDGKTRICFEDLPQRWCRALDLTHEREILLPIDWFYLINEYNGPAAGNSLEEAILQGLCEVVERHVSSVITHDGMETPTVDPASIKHPAGRELLEKFERQGIKVYLKDFSLDTGIPTIGALAYDPSTFPASSEIVFTAGTTTDPEKSVIRALTEVAQLAGEFKHRTTYRPTLPKFSRPEDAFYLTSSSRFVDLAGLPDLSNDNFRQEIRSCTAALEKVGMDVFAVNVTHPQLGIPAVYVVIPGAHFMDRTRENSVAYHAARLISQHSDPDLAFSELGRMFSLFPDRYEIRFFLGYACERKELPEAALSHFEASLRLAPRGIDLASIYCHLGIAYRDQSLFDDAIEMLETARAHDPSLKEIYEQLGFCYFKQGKYESAIEQFEKALEIDPGSALDYANIGANLRAMGHIETAIPLFKMALDIDPDLEFARVQLNQLIGN
jgi:ribosomal protein S12 methylthiotransferase accessory factor